MIGIVSGEVARHEARKSRRNVSGEGFEVKERPVKKDEKPAEAAVAETVEVAEEEPVTDENLAALVKKYADEIRAKNAQMNPGVSKDGASSGVAEEEDMPEEDEVERWRAVLNGYGKNGTPEKGHAWEKGYRAWVEQGLDVDFADIWHAQMKIEARFQSVIAAKMPDQLD